MFSNERNDRTQAGTGESDGALAMIDRTSTGRAPWIVIPANDKNFARVKIARTVVKHLEEELGG